MSILLYIMDFRLSVEIYYETDTQKTVYCIRQLGPGICPLPPDCVTAKYDSRAWPYMVILLQLRQS
jgi:hypothetical protein